MKPFWNAATPEWAKFLAQTSKAVGGGLPRPPMTVCMTGKSRAVAMNWPPAIRTGVRLWRVGLDRSS